MYRVMLGSEEFRRFVHLQAAIDSAKRLVHTCDDDESVRVMDEAGAVLTTYTMHHVIEES